MSRNLLALAIAASLAAPAVAAAENTGPTVYGRLHVSLSNLDNGDDSSLNVSSNASRLGFKGTHDLAEGLQGFYQIESEIQADNGSGSLSSRNTFAGLKGGFGAVKVGQFDTPLKSISSSIDLFGDQVGDLDNITRRAYGAHFDERAKNSIGYTSPKFGDMVVDLQYSTNMNGGSNDPDTDNWMFSGALSYKAGPAYASLAVQTYGEDHGNGDDSPTLVRLGGYYDLGALRLTAMVQAGTDDPTLGDTTGLAVGARYTMGKAALKAQINTIDADTDERNATMLALGVDYKVAKNLTGYVNYAMISNDDASGLTPYRDLTDGAGGVAGEDTSAFSLGMVYNF